VDSERRFLEQIGPGARAELLATSLLRYQARAITTAQVIEELIELAREMREAASRGEELGLTDEDVSFYDALGTNESAVAVFGDETLRTIARELGDARRCEAGAQEVRVST